MKRLTRNQEVVPVVMFHSVGMNHDQWIWKHLSEPTPIFEGFLRRLQNAGYKTVTLEQLFAHMEGSVVCDEKSIALVFDDGYLDNWLYVYPLLRKYEMCGTVYVNPEFVEPGEECRPPSEDHRAPDSPSLQGHEKGFMNWAELRKSDSEGVLDVQSHSMSHTWHFKGPDILDCYSPQNAGNYPWMQWNARPDRKPYYLREDQTGFVKFGTPIFDYEKALITRRFIPDSAIVREIQDSVEKIGRERFFQTSNYLEKFRGIVSSIVGKTASFPGEYESDDTYQGRIDWELAESKRIIEAKLNKTVDFLCWPGGGVNEAAKKAAKKAGYKSWTLPGGKVMNKRNVPGADPSEIIRVPALKDVFFLGKRWGVGTEMLMLLDVFAHQDSMFFDVLRKFYKVGVAFGIAGEK